MPKSLARMYAQPGTMLAEPNSDVSADIDEAENTVTQPEPGTYAAEEELGVVEGEVEIEGEVKPSSAIAAALSVQPTNTPLIVFIGTAKHC